MADERKGFTVGQIFATAVAGLIAGGSFYKIQKMEQPTENLNAPSGNPTRSEFEIACEYLDLPKAGQFTQAEFKSKVREFRILYHPDGKTKKEQSRLTLMSQRIAWAEQVIEANRAKQWGSARAEAY